MDNVLIRTHAAEGGPILGAIIDAIRGFGGSAHQDVIVDFVTARAAAQGADRQAIRETVCSVLERHRAMACAQAAGALRPMFGPESRRWTVQA